MTQTKNSTKTAKPRTYPLIIGITLALLVTSTLGAANDLNSHAGSTKAVWLGPEGSPLPFSTPEEVEEFLATATVVGMKDIPVGVTKPRKLTLESRGIRAHAIFRNLDVFKQKWDVPGESVKLNFRDSCLFEYASYRVARLLGLDQVPPVVVREFRPRDFKRHAWYRKLGKKKGTLQLWIEQAFTEKHRAKENLQPPDPTEWMRQWQLMFVFDNLIYNIDRNQGNILIDSNWRIWFIDATRAFRPNEELRSPNQIKRIDRHLWDRLNLLTKADIEEALKGTLPPSLIKGLCSRQQALLRHVTKLVDEKGQQFVLRGNPAASSPRTLESAEAELVQVAVEQNQK